MTIEFALETLRDLEDLACTRRIRAAVDALWRRETARREAIALDFLSSGAFRNELSSVEQVGRLSSWRIW